MAILDLLGIVGKVLDKIIPDPKAKADALLALQKLQQDGDLAVIAGQVDINKVEAASTNLFIAGWRPFIGWICGIGLGYDFLLRPLLTWITALIGKGTAPPSLDTSTLVTLLIGMLGLGGMRTVEKLSNAQGNH